MLWSLMRMFFLPRSAWSLSSEGLSLSRRAGIRAMVFDEGGLLQAGLALSGLASPDGVRCAFPTGPTVLCCWVKSTHLQLL